MSKTTSPLVSVVVITYNSAAFVVETLESMKEQTYENIELIVSDDCSIDNTVAICKEWLKENADRFVRTELVTTTKNTGIAPNFNRGIAVSKGEWIKTIAGDDALYPDIIEKYIEFATKHQEVMFLHSDVVVFKDTFDELNRLPSRSTPNSRINTEGIEAKEQYQILLRHCFIWAATVMIKRDVFNRIGFFDESLPMWEDRPMWLKITGNNIRLTYLNILGAKYRISSSSIQSQNKNVKLYSNFDINLEKAFYERFLKLLPLPERIVKGIKIKRNQILDKYGFNKNIKIIRGFVKITNYPLDALLRNFQKKYL